MKKPTSIHVRCPKCGQDGWLHSVEPKAYYSNFRTEGEHEDGKIIYGKDIPRTQRRHPYKWMSFIDSICGHDGIKHMQQHQHPTINPTPSSSTSILKPGHDGYNEHWALVEQMSGIGSTFKALAEVMPLALKKYPSLIAEANKFNFCFSVVRRGLHSSLDNRQARSLFEWIAICETALEEGIGAAAKKYSGITEDGREVRLSDKNQGHDTKSGRFRSDIPLLLDRLPGIRRDYC